MKIKKSVLVLLSFIVFDSKMNAANEFKGVTFASAIRKAQDYKQKSENLAASLGTPVKPVTGGTSTQASAIRYGIAWKEEYERLKALQAANSSGHSSPAGTPSMSRSPSSNNFSGMSSPSVPFKLFPSTPSKAQLETMEIERLRDAAIIMQQQLEELQKASSDSTSTSGHDTTTAISVPSTQDRELNRVFNGNREMVEAYKLAVENGNLGDFWSAVKTEIIQKLTERINKIQPGDANADLLIQPTWVFVEHAAKKGEFLSKVAGAINNLDLSAIPMPSNSSGPMALHDNYMQKINAALWALIDTIVPGKDDSIVLHGSIDPSRMETNQSPRTKLAFRNVLLSAIR